MPSGDGRLRIYLFREGSAINSTRKAVFLIVALIGVEMQSTTTVSYVLSSPIYKMIAFAMDRLAVFLPLVCNENLETLRNLPTSSKSIDKDRTNKHHEEDFYNTSI